MQKCRNTKMQIPVTNSSTIYATDNKTYQKRFFTSLDHNSARNNEAYKFLLKIFSALWDCFDNFFGTNYSTRELGTSNTFISGWWKGRSSLIYWFSQWSLERYYRSYTINLLLYLRQLTLHNLVLFGMMETNVKHFRSWL